MNMHRHHSDLTSTSGLRRALLICVSLVLLCAGSGAAAQVKLDKLRDFKFGTWSTGAGDLVASQDFCVQSDFFGVFPLDWAARLDDLSGASSASEFRIGNRAGSDSVAIEVRLIDLRTGVEDYLLPGAQTDFDHSGDTSKCPRGLNGRLEVRIAATALAAAEAGRFEGDFQFVATRFGTDADRFRIRVDVPDLVQVSDLDDIALGSYGGMGDMVGSDQVCVYRNDPSARYDVEASGQGPGQAFVVEQPGASLPFQVDYDDGSGYQTLRAGKSVRARGADSASPSCGGAGNANIRVTVRQADLASARLGDYAGTLTLTVAPI